ncbi:hypothetical protein ACET3Z_000046 [Daucus carota]
MNHGTQNSGSQDFENQLLMSSNVWYTDEGQSQQLPFLPFTPAETQVQGVAVATPPLQAAENEVFVNEQYFALPPLTNPTPGVVQDEADYNYWIGNMGTADEQISRGAEAPLWEVETNHQFHQAVTSPAAVPQAGDGLWALELPPLDDDLYPLIVSPADDFAPVFTEPTSQVAAPAPAFTAAQATSVGAAVEANQEEAEAQVEEEADADLGSSTQAMKSYREHHNERERRRRDKISDRIDQLRELVPGCKKVRSLRFSCSATHVMADDRILELSPETAGRYLETSAPQLVDWGEIQHLDDSVFEPQQDDLFLNHLHFLTFVSAPTPTPVADLLISAAAPTQQEEQCLMNMTRNEDMVLPADDSKQLSTQTKGRRLKPCVSSIFSIELQLFN